MLEENGYIGFEKNRECPHITLINSDVIAKVQEQFNLEYGSESKLEFEKFFLDLTKQMNQELKKEDHPIIFTQLCATYSEDYPPFEELIAAKIESTAALKALKKVNEAIMEKLGIGIGLKPKSSFHLTIAIKYRVAQLPSHISDIDDLIQETGPLSEVFKTFFEKMASH
jgi:hypothetical protein